MFVGCLLVCLCWSIGHRYGVLLQSLLTLLDRVISEAAFLPGDVFPCDLNHDCKVTVSCALYKIFFHNGLGRPLRHLLSKIMAHVRNTLCVVSLDEIVHDPVWCRNLVWKTFIPFNFSPLEFSR